MIGVRFVYESARLLVLGSFGMHVLAAMEQSTSVFVRVLLAHAMMALFNRAIKHKSS